MRGSGPARVCQRSQRLDGESQHGGGAMNMRNWQNRRTQRTDRWKREDDAPRLRQEVPNLESLRMNLEEFSGGHRVVGTSRIQHVVVAQASTRFEIPCGDSKCEDGGHDLTREALGQLRAGRE